MSDLSMYELEDIIWDDFDRGGDHIVPHPTNDRTGRNSFEGDNCKKPRRESTPVLNNTRNLDSKPLDKKKNMMEKQSSLSHAPPALFNAPCEGDIVKDMPNLASDGTRMSNNCFKSSYATSAAGDNNSYSYPLADISQSEDLCFADDNCENKESGDLLYYNWPDIGNFEDVDKMLRSCDSSFGLGGTDNDDELGWFTSDHNIGGTEQALKMDFRFPCPEPSALKNISSNHDSPDSNNPRSCCISESKEENNDKDQVNLQRKQHKTGHHVGNDGSLYQISDMESNETQISEINKSDQILTPIENPQQYRNLEFDCFSQMQNNSSYLPPNYPYQTITDPVPPGIKSEHKDLKSCSLSNASSSSNMMFQPSKSAEKQAHVSGKEVESQRDVGVKKGISHVPEMSSDSSELDEISLEATSFRQLQQVMEQLDMRTKLCIRDSLYRLAKSAEQRHHNNPSAATDDERTNKCSGFMDMETDTNPIDRSVAHLLFHRPSESSKLPLNPNVNDGCMVEKVEEAAGESNDKMKLG